MADDMTALGTVDRPAGAVAGAASGAAAGAAAGTAAGSAAGTVAGTAAGTASVRLLTAVLVLLVGIPSVMIFAPLGAVGTPAQVLALGCLAGWSFQRLAGVAPAPRRNAVYVVMAVFVLTVAVSYLVAASRPLGADESSGLDRGLISTLSWAGLLLFAGDGPRSFAQLDTLLRRLSIAGAVEATVGLAQYVTQQPIIDLVTLPGLKPNGAILDPFISERGEFVRPAGTAIHSIEFGAVLTMILPIALHLALFDKHRDALSRWAPVALIAFAIPISISRTAILSAAVVALVVLPSWNRTWRRRGYLGLAALVGAVYLAVPGLLGTLRDLFTQIGNDSSAASRTSSYPLAEAMVGRSPWFGRGFGTLLPEYRIFDNQLLGTLVQTGVVGLAALLALMIAPVGLTLAARRRFADEAGRHRCTAMAAAVAALSSSFAFYDALSFPMAACLFFIIIGLCAALLRLSATDVARRRGTLVPAGEEVHQ